MNKLEPLLAAPELGRRLNRLGFTGWSAFVSELESVWSALATELESVVDCGVTPPKKFGGATSLGILVNTSKDGACEVASLLPAPAD